jgi:hypothetical protein
MKLLIGFAIQYENLYCQDIYVHIYIYTYIYIHIYMYIKIAGAPRALFTQHVTWLPSRDRRQRACFRLVFTMYSC